LSGISRIQTEESESQDNGPAEQRRIFQGASRGRKGVR